MKKLDDKEAVVMVFRQRPDPEIEQMSREVRRMLGLREEGGNSGWSTARRRAVMRRSPC